MSRKVVTFLILCFTSAAFAEDFKTVNGKEYKDATVTRVDPDGVVVKTKSGITKVYFIELPKEVQERFHYDSEKAASYSAEQATNYTAYQKQQDETQQQQQAAACEKSRRCRSSATRGAASGCGSRARASGIPVHRSLVTGQVSRTS
jgi:sRNA-binding protein